MFDFEIEAIIFDYDDTLVSSIPLHFEAYKRVLLEVGIEITKQEYYNSIGGIAKELIPKLLNGRSCKISIEEIHKRKISIFLSIIETEEIKLLETAKLLSVFYGKYKMAVASAGSGIQIHKMIDKLNIRKYFDTIITADDVSNGKPDPEAFILAAKNMNVKPENCIVFGDSDADILGAKNAGMQSFDVRKTVI
jgi:HAD superfamily hydrolase (TIGR01549 family)